VMLPRFQSYFQNHSPSGAATCTSEIKAYLGLEQIL